MSLPSCPSHPRARVSRWGSYGTRRRQRFHCSGNGGHTFTETLPRQMTATGDCDECERRLAAHEGPPGPRQGTYTVREIATALVRVGEGMSYRKAARLIRGKAHRLIHRDGRMVADWVEAYVPLLAASHAPTAWPDVLLLDEIPFHIRYQNKPSGRQPYSVLGAFEWRPDGEHKLVRLEARGGASKQDWIEFLSSLPGTPRRIVCDAAKSPLAAMAAVWPQTAMPPGSGQTPEVFLCHYHLGRRFRELLKKHRALDHPAAALIEDAFSGPWEWRWFVATARSLAVPAIQTWLDAYESRVAWQVQHMRDETASTGPLETQLREIRDTLTYRRFSIRNRERLNRWLLLWQLNYNGHAGERHYSTLIRAALASRAGYAPPRRQITDAAGLSSLWR